MTIKTLAILAATSCLFVTPLRAHHGAAAYNRAQTVRLEATIVDFDWENPHALIHFEARHGESDPEEWIAETAGLVILARAGWNRETLAAGDRCTVVGHPAKNGSRTMILERIVLDDGRELGNYIP